MKKTIKVIALAMVALMLMLALVSCGAKPNADPDKAVEALKANGYNATKSSGDEDEGITATVVAYSADMKQNVSIAYCKDEASAEKQYEDAKASIDGLKEIAEAAGMEYNYEVGISGTVVWMGTPDAIKAAA